MTPTTGPVQHLSCCTQSSQTQSIDTQTCSIFTSASSTRISRYTRSTSLTMITHT